MADNAAEVIAEVQTDAAAQAVESVAAVVVTGDTIIENEVRNVEGQLAEHAAESETRHEEILEETWDVQNELRSMSSTLTAIQAQVSAAMTLIQAFQTMVMARLDQIPSTGSPQSNPENSSTPEPTPEPPIVVETPEAVAVAVADPPEVETPRKKRRVI